jgi:hypothetical protein
MNSTSSRTNYTNDGTTTNNSGSIGVDHRDSQGLAAAVQRDGGSSSSSSNHNKKRRRTSSSMSSSSLFLNPESDDDSSTSNDDDDFGSLATTTTTANTKKSSLADSMVDEEEEEDADGRGTTTATAKYSSSVQQTVFGTPVNHETMTTTKTNGGMLNDHGNKNNNSSSSNTSTNKKKRRFSVSDAMLITAEGGDKSSTGTSLKDFYRQGAKFKTLLDDAMGKVAATLGTAKTTVQDHVAASADSSSSSSSGRTAMNINELSSHALLHRLAREKQTENLLLQQKLEQQQSNTVTLEALLKDVQETRAQQATQISRLTFALKQASQNASQARYVQLVCR